MFAQNWNVFEPGQRRYYVNANGYLRTMRLDSVSSQGSDLHYYPRRRLHFDIYGITSSAFNDTAGSWLGGDVTMRPDGTFMFPNYWGDTVIIKSRAELGATWTFYQGDGSIYYLAEVTGLDTMTILGMLDSIKTITLRAYVNGNPVPLDSFDNTELVLSKDNGFYATMDMHYFPYHEPDTNILFDDYYLANSLKAPGDIAWTSPDTPGKANCIFTLTDYRNPTPAEMFNWNVGDIYQYDACFAGMLSSYCGWPYSYKLDTIIDKIYLPYGVEYVTRGWSALAVYNQPFNTITHYTFTATQDTLFIPDTGKYFQEYQFPEEYVIWSGDPRVVFYYLPNVTGTCFTSDMYFESSYATGLGGQGDSRGYIKGLGLVYGRSFYFGDWAAYGHQYLIYSLRNGVPCGTYVFPDTSAPVVNSVTSVHEDAFKVYPNPASEELRIEASNSLYSIELLNSIGQLVFTKDNYRGRQNIDLRDYAEGIYILRLTTANGNRFDKKIIIQH